MSDYCNRYPNLSDVEATDFGVNLGIIEVTATDWSNKDPGPPSARWNAFDRDYTYALNAMSSAASHTGSGPGTTDPQTLQSAEIDDEGDNYLTTALGSSRRSELCRGAAPRRAVSTALTEGLPLARGHEPHLDAPEVDEGATEGA